MVIFTSLLLCMALKKNPSNIVFILYLYDSLFVSKSVLYSLSTACLNIYWIMDKIFERTMISPCHIINSWRWHCRNQVWSWDIFGIDLDLSWPYWHLYTDFFSSQSWALVSLNMVQILTESL